MRAGPGIEYPVVGGATLGQEFAVTGKNADGSWLQIDLDGQPGWIFAPYVTAVDTENVPVVAAGETEMMEKRAFVTVDGDMNVRNGPGTNYAVIGPATYGQEYDITGQSEDGEWWRIEYNGQTGWIFAPFVEAAGGENVAIVGSGEVAARGGAVVTVNGEMNVREGPGTTYEIVGAATTRTGVPHNGEKRRRRLVADRLQRADRLALRPICDGSQHRERACYRQRRDGRARGSTGYHQR